MAPNQKQPTARKRPARKKGLDSLLAHVQRMPRVVVANEAASPIRRASQPQRNVTRYPASIYADNWPAPAGT